MLGGPYDVKVIIFNWSFRFVSSVILFWIQNFGAETFFNYYFIHVFFHCRFNREAGQFLIDLVKVYDHGITEE